MLSNFFYLSLNSLRYHRLRSWLTIIGIIIGMAVVMAVLFLGEGMENAVTYQLQRFGSNIIIVIPGKIGNPLFGLLGRNRFRDKDLKVIEKIDGIDIVMPTIEPVLAKVKFFGEEKTTILHGQPWSAIKKIFEESEGFSLAKGEWPTNDEAREIVVGFKLAKIKFKKEVQIGDFLIIKGREYKVKGILNEIGEQNHDNAVFISIKMIRQIMGEEAGYRNFTIKALSNYDLDQVAENIRYELSRQKGIGDFTVLTSSKAARLVGNIIGIIQFVLGAIAAVALIVGSVGIMNTMYTSVIEQTKEIGIMKAVGARNSHIILIYLIESGIIGLVGGVVGIIFGIGLAKAVELYAHKAGFSLLIVTFSPKIIIEILGFAFLLGIISGSLPARQAAKLRPTEALRYEE